MSPAVAAQSQAQVVRPEYPAEARRQRLQGEVVLEAVIGESGAVEELRILSGHPLLSQAAYDAVKQWRYRPILVDGKPSRVTTTITTHFAFR